MCFKIHEILKYENIFILMEKMGKNIAKPQSLRKFPRLYRTAGLVDWKNLPDQPQFHQTDTILEQTTKKEKKNKFLSLNVI